MRHDFEIDEGLGDLLRRELPVPEHRDGFREDVAARMTAEAAARAGGRRYRYGRRRNATSPALQRPDETTHVQSPIRGGHRGLRIALVAASVVLFLAGLGVGVFQLVPYLGRDGRFLVVSDETTPRAVLTAVELRERETAVIGFSNRFFGAWPDADALGACYTEDATIFDPSDGSFDVQGREVIKSFYRNFFSYVRDVRVLRDNTCISADGAAYAVTPVGLWPPWVPEPPDHPNVKALDLMRFDKDLIASEEMWFSPATLEMVSFGVFAPGGGGSAHLRQLAERYLAAWSSGDKARIAALYRDDAVFSDSLMDLQAQGPAAISELGTKRFGSSGRAGFEILDLYAQTNGADPFSADKPEQGAIAGMAIHFRCVVPVGGRSVSFEGVVVCELGTRQASTFAVDPNGSIEREEVFYDAGSLIAAGFAR
jgi:ketosteroid isomerase-like protein